MYQTLWQSVAYLHIHQLQPNINVHLKFYFWQPGESKSNTTSFFNSVFGLFQLLREISDPLASKYFSKFTSLSLTVSV